jgi:hypothetical protein
MVKFRNEKGTREAQKTLKKFSKLKAKIAMSYIYVKKYLNNISE